MKITVLVIPDCPGEALIRQRLSEALAARADSTIDVEFHTLVTDDDAAQWQFNGSPTLLIDGHDPFPVSTQTQGPSCRIYRNADGLESAPSISDISAAIAAHEAPLT